MDDTKHPCLRHHINAILSLGENNSLWWSSNLNPKKSTKVVQDPLSQMLYLVFPSVSWPHLHHPQWSLYHNHKPLGQWYESSDVFISIALGAPHISISHTARLNMSNHARKEPHCCPTGAYFRERTKEGHSWRKEPVFWTECIKGLAWIAFMHNRLHGAELIRVLFILQIKVPVFSRVPIVHPIRPWRI